MADTINVAVNTPKVWTEVLAGETTGIVSLAGNGQHCIHDGDPDSDLIGHRFTGDLVSFALGATESLWVYADTKTVAIITED